MHFLTVRHLLTEASQITKFILDRGVKTNATLQSMNFCRSPLNSSWKENTEVSNTTNFDQSKKNVVAINVYYTGVQYILCHVYGYF